MSIRARTLMISLTACLLPVAPALAAAPTDPVLEGYLEAALRSNLALRQQRLSVDESLAVLAQARAQFLPTVSLEARASKRYGAVLDLGDLVNPAYATLNQLLGSQAFPTDIEVALPFGRETRLVATQPLFAPALLHQHALRRDEAAATRARWQTFARQLRADVQTAYFQHGRASNWSLCWTRPGSWSRKTCG